MSFLQPFGFPKKLELSRAIIAFGFIHGNEDDFYWQGSGIFGHEIFIA